MCEPTKSTLRLDHTTGSCRKFISQEEILFTVINFLIQTFLLLSIRKGEFRMLGNISILKTVLKAEGKAKVLTYHSIYTSHHKSGAAKWATGSGGQGHQPELKSSND